MEKGTALSPSPQDRQKAFTLAWIRPLKLLFLSPIILVLGLYLAIMISYAQICFATIGTVFQDRYGFSPGQSGMAYFGLTTGFLASQILLGYFSDRYNKRMSAKHGNITPEHRLPPIFIGALTLPIGLLWYGWSLQERSQLDCTYCWQCLYCGGNSVYLLARSDVPSRRIHGVRGERYRGLYHYPKFLCSAHPARREPIV